MTYKVAIVGTGADPNSPDAEGFAMAYRHAGAYTRLDSCELVGCADIVRENAEQFAERWDIPAANVFEETREMLAAVEPDIVSVCVPPHVHAPVVMEVARGESVRAIHCEKPMATTWEDCREMVDLCEQRDVKLTFNHQRRFAGPFTRAKQELDSGTIGTLERVELGGDNLFDFGSHLFDLCGYFTDQSRAEWVLAGIDYSEENIQFGAHNENMAIAQWRYENGVYGLAATGDEGMLSCMLRLVGSDGVLEIGGEEAPLRAQVGGEWRTLDSDGDTVHGPKGSLVEAAKQRVAARVPMLSAERARTATFIDRAIADVVDAVETGTESALCASNALQATELIFACWESARRRTRVDLPLEIADNPLESMVEEGELLAD
jgi:predicted dehydrogenase